MSFEFMIGLTDGISGPAKNAAGSLGGLTDSLGGAQGGMEGLDAICPGLGEALGVIGPIAIGVAAAFAALVVGSMALALQASEAKGKLTTLFDALGEGKISGAQTISMLDGLAESIGSTRGALAPLAQKFMAMGVTGVDQLKSLTLAAASAGAMAEGGGEKFATLFKKISAAASTGQALKIPLKGLGSLADMGLRVDDVAKKMGISAAALGTQLKNGSVNATKFGDALQSALIDKGAGPLARAGSSLTNIWAKFGEDVTKMFEDVDVGPFLAQVKSLFSIFSQSSPSGQAMKSGIGGALNFLFKAATKVVPYVQHFLLGLEIAALKIYIKFKPLIASVGKLFGGAGDGGDKLTPLLDMLVSGISGVASAVIYAGIGFATFVSTFVNGFNLVVSGVQTAIGFFTTLKDAIVGLFTGSNTIASDFVDGLIAGITGGVGKAVDAAKNLAKSALGGITGALGISSPSKEMYKLGGHTVGGFVDAIDDGAGDAKGAMADMAKPPSVASAKAAGAGAAGSGGGSGGKSIDVGGIVINITGVAGAESATDAMISKLAQAFAQLQLEAGG